MPQVVYTLDGRGLQREQDGQDYRSHMFCLVFPIPHNHWTKQLCYGRHPEDVVHLRYFCILGVDKLFAICNKEGDKKNTNCVLLFCWFRKTVITNWQLFYKILFYLLFILQITVTQPCRPMFKIFLKVIYLSWDNCGSSFSRETSVAL